MIDDCVWNSIYYQIINETKEVSLKIIHAFYPCEMFLCDAAEGNLITGFCSSLSCVFSHLFAHLSKHSFRLSSYWWSESTQLCSWQHVVSNSSCFFFSFLVFKTELKQSISMMMNILTIKTITTVDLRDLDLNWHFMPAVLTFSLYISRSSTLKLLVRSVFSLKLARPNQYRLRVTSTGSSWNGGPSAALLAPLGLDAGCGGPRHQNLEPRKTQCVNSVWIFFFHDAALRRPKVTELAWAENKRT